MQLQTKKIFTGFISIFSLLLFLLGCEKEISITPEEDPPPKGFLFVNSSPPGSYIYLEGENTGVRTPGLIRFIEDREYQVTLKRKYYRDTLFIVNVNENDTVDVEIDYTQNPLMRGNLRISSVPDSAQIFINDSLTGIKTPHTFTGLLPGAYNIKLKIDSYRDEEVSGIVKSETTTNVTAELRDTSVWIDYQVFNSDIQSNLSTSLAIFNNVKWIGTSDAGIIKFDDNSFQNFNTSNSSIPSNTINTIETNLNGDVWIGTENGAAKYSGGTWSVFNTSNSGLSNNSVHSIRFDQVGNVYLGTSNGLNIFNGTNWTVLTYNSENVDFLWVNDFQFSADETIWIGTNNYGILSYSNSIFTEYNIEDFLYPTKKISAVNVDHTGLVWFGHRIDSAARAGISSFDGISFSNYLLGTSTLFTNSIYVDDENMKLFATNEGLLMIDELSQSFFYNSNNSLISSNSTTDVVVDSEGVVWITTSGGGLNKFKILNR